MATPLYQTVIDTIVARIASGELPSGALLPSETQLGAELGVSQGTARKALSELEKRGLVQRAQGRGTFVTLRTPEMSLFNFFRLRSPDGTLTAPELVSETVIRRQATAEERAALFGRPEEVIEIRRVRSVGGRRTTYERSCLPPALYPGIVDRAPLPNALYVLYQRAYSIIIVRADEKLRAVGAPADVAAALELGEGAPVLLMRRAAVDVLDRVVELRVCHLVSEGLDYFVTLS
ncbi:GntR family transcriptional regulator [Rhodovulum sulfidophilum]|uniref:GntR family transcriptional regulator n=1 Tax=Rhodovulum sulfidophilum TaxID=35806 RepID=UPI0013894563|nr:GntR family transcriptional regulator [Rhodovulum sulfidophilum]NDK35017.1 GntR family transcriptional regulator [Rhodovulum sulfidophilum]